MADADVEASLVSIWREIATAWLTGYYLLMPDHLHLFCAPYNLEFSIEKWISFWKADFRRTHLTKDWFFQRNGFHHRIRSADEFSEKWTYVSENPVRKGLVNCPDDWPFQGVVHEIRWSGS